MSGIGKRELIELYDKLLQFYGKQNWWPVDLEYHKTHGSDPREEVIIGAILTQNTSWKNVEKALENLKREKALNLKAIKEIPTEKLMELIKPAGFYRQKSLYLKEFANKFPSISHLKNVKREDLLKVKGIGKETADAILLYALDRLEFVVDAYTKRLLERLWNIKGSYEEIKRLFEKNLPKDLEIYREFHALIDIHAKEFCKKKPLCEECPLREKCIKSCF
ncbi:endonuclease III domain-containing protein [Aquifex aeolicus]|uniref:Endonuclease III n=1 Tax=Aquifex aeolicus (strain VF5) TaxID=224324 RepID=O66559_AQUAE|nr:endonuclease III domain-containing protein [Aquifex aeolicus]AAC06526.1 endonuclease III [Aquifex aeolicus VF5]